MTLADLKPGDVAEVTGIAKGRRAQMRLLEMGISPGTRLLVVAAHPLKGPVVVRIGMLEAALGWGLASSVLVRRVFARDEPRGKASQGSEGSPGYAEEMDDESRDKPGQGQ